MEEVRASDAALPYSSYRLLALPGVPIYGFGVEFQKKKRKSKNERHTYVIDSCPSG